MNSKLRKACHTKSILGNQYFRGGRMKDQWESYWKSRNAATKWKAESMKRYFEDKCNPMYSTVKQNVFWDSIKPFMTEKVKHDNKLICLKIDNSIISRPAAVCNAFSNYFSSIASSFGNNDDALKEFEDIESILAAHSDHPSIRCIQENFANSMPFDFTEITVQNMRSLIREMNPKGAGFDNIPPKILKIASDELAEPIAALLNDSIRTFEFPGDLKMSELLPLIKNKDSLYRGNYQPVNILQLRKHFDDILSSLLAAFRKNHGCQHVLVKLIEDCKIALDSREYVGLVLTDLSKAFDCLPHRLLLWKLYNYGLSKKACQLIRSYLYNRKQRVKIGCERSMWSSIYKGVPQGSVLGPILFNIFYEWHLVYI